MTMIQEEIVLWNCIETDKASQNCSEINEVLPN